MSKKQSNNHEERMFNLLTTLIREPVREHRFWSGGRLKPSGETTTFSKWRFDFAYPELKLAFEVEGGTWIPRSGHTHPIAYAKDCEKYNFAVKLGWTVYRVTPEMINLEYLEMLIYEIIVQPSPDPV